METKAEVKELILDFVLIMYDIPAVEKKLRHRFIRDALEMGAEQYTESVYLLPFSEKALEMANELESAGHAVVFSAHQHDIKTAVEINVKYSTGIKNRCKVIEQRLVIVQEYIKAGKLLRAQGMGLKTGKLLKELIKINAEEVICEDELHCGDR
ncbi:hypothetical protein LCGC14_2820560 [marine sediment metagenome]|uniref:Transcriptional repressor PaaX-like central Cas2-like domain-containing protein n=1 Tax=marine sediment metagenome TaxID=412755 RepID=A0A0F9B8B8_9ZZZZ